MWQPAATYSRLPHHHREERIMVEQACEGSTLWQNKHDASCRTVLPRVHTSRRALHHYYDVHVRCSILITQSNSSTSCVSFAMGTTILVDIAVVSDAQAQSGFTLITNLPRLLAIVCPNNNYDRCAKPTQELTLIPIVQWIPFFIIR
jgi:hypothetical protein